MTNYTPKTLLALMLMAVLVVPPLTYAQEAPPEPPPQEVVEEPQEEAAQETDEEGPETAETIEVFESAETTETTEVTETTDTSGAEDQTTESPETQEPAVEETVENAEVTVTTDDEVTEEVSEAVDEFVEDLTASTTEPLGSATSTEPGPEIETGTAVALANILNLVNTNFVNSEGAILFWNFFNPVTGVLDFRSYYNSLIEGTCADSPCTMGDSLSIQLTNDAMIENDLLIAATTGNNMIDNTGMTSITTGDAYAGLNLVNIANTNVVDSSYLLVTVNAFQGVDGDVVFPSLTDFLRSIVQGATSPRTIDIESTATVENNLAIDADSGGNSGPGAIQTGDSHATTNVFNEINTNLIGDRSVSILFRVHGDWAGEVFGAPEGLSWVEGADGSVYLFDTAAGGGGGGGTPVDVTASSRAFIRNNVTVMALTGDNHINGSETALISTGDAYAGANIVNIANGNVIGRNWILAVINIFGDFNGNIAFGRPDLWIGEQVDIPSKVSEGDALEYKFTVINNGDSPATQVRVADDFDEGRIEIIDSPYAYTLEGGEITFAVGELPPGSATEITYRARIVDAPPGTDITNVVSIQSRETDNNLEDNTDTATVRTYQSSGGTRRDRDEEEGQFALGVPRPAALELTRTTASTTADYGTIVREELVLYNESGKPSVPVVVRDILRDPAGNVLKEEVWNLGEILAGEEVTMTYDIEFAAQAMSGLYTLSTVIDGPGDDDAYYLTNGTIELGTELPMPVIPAAQEAIESVVGEVLGAFTHVPLPAEASEYSEGEVAAPASAPYGIAALLAGVAGVGGGLWYVLGFWLRRRRD